MYASLRKNVLANYIGTGFVVLAPMLALPYYLHALGSSIWGLVGFITTLQAMLSILDAGVSQALVREFATNKQSNQQKQYDLGVLLYGFERLYWIFALAVGFVVFLSTHQIIHYWLKLDSVSADQARIAIYGAAAIFIFQFPGSVYRSLLVGTQAQVLLNTIMTLGSLTRHVGGVLVVLVWPTLSAYLLWQVFSVAIETFARCFYSWRTLQMKRSESYWNMAFMKKMSLPVVGMSGASLLGALTVQMDKIVLSGMVSVEKFGYYVIASTLALGVLQLLYPIVNVAIPYAVNLKDDSNALRKFNFKYAKLVSLMILIFGAVFYAFGIDFLTLWLKSPSIAVQVYELLTILLIGTALNVLYTIGYINWIVKGHLIRVFQVNLISLVVSVVSIPIMVARFGMAGACLGWITINAVGLFFSLGWLLRNDSNSYK